ncbi:glycine cleavage system protein H [Virgibacillus profundi]|uniref:Glycine cleavage system protein H n=1 Tax=Virgibacillus profundi TaxID=2024555 RepID=A0A2A2I938_9BACI|nr:glycine cleavage system protein H [Virgibacillus profundi]PAV28147.1 glycine cleavage system protein H [Virgibacillus profundi]PXY52452.1 glycine cleavage system protein H [Virgibacillus profundi]
MKKRGNFLFIEKNDDIYTLSMTPEMQDDIGTVGFVEYLDGDTLNVDDAILNLEAAKTVLELASPIAGKIVGRNEAAISEPALLNSAKTEENWVVKLTDVDEAAFNKLEEA